MRIRSAPFLRKMNLTRADRERQSGKVRPAGVVVSGAAHPMFGPHSAGGELPILLGRVSCDSSIRHAFLDDADQREPSDSLAEPDRAHAAIDTAACGHRRRGQSFADKNSLRGRRRPAVRRLASAPWDRTRLSSKNPSQTRRGSHVDNRATPGRLYVEIRSAGPARGALLLAAEPVAAVR